MKFALYGLILFLGIGITLAREAVTRVGLETNYLLIALVALLFTALLAHRSFMLVLLIIGLCVVINLPPEMLGGVVVDQDIMIAALISVIILPAVHRVLVR
ncbi:MAG: hypothetical protein Q7U82_13380 [Gammaproteobacteria bacterium]|nr:hypothetical protein [Gammaproteobacteria bacterium]